MIDIKSEKNCCGCMACFTVCPKKCITQKNGNLGAVFPEVNMDTCVNCGKCETVCPMLNKVKNNPTTDETYAALSNNSEVLFGGSSGGMFETFAATLIKDGYTVYGAAFGNDLKLKCTAANGIDELRPLRKSKYLQSSVCEKYEEIKNKLENGENVLFVSTPCQNAALKLFLNKQYNNLITVDFLCHGVPSQDFFDDCIKYAENKENIKITNFEFRTKKKNGTTPHYYTVTYKKKAKEKKKTGYYFEFPFYAAFQQYVTLRESCYDCKFAGKDRVTDITISDFHDIDKYIKGINRFSGVSTVFIHTEKGKQLFKSCSDSLNTYKLDLSMLINDKVCFCGGTKRPKNREEFIKCYENGGVQALVDNYLSPKFYRKQKIYYSLPSFLRKILREVNGI